MNIFKSILESTLLPKLFDLIDGLHTSEEEKLLAKLETQKLQSALLEKIIEASAQELSAQKDILVAEIQGKSWMQRNWRPILMLTIVAIIVNNYILFPYAGAIFPDVIKVLDLPSELWTLMTIGVGGYIGGRTVEKIANNVGSLNVLKTSDKNNNTQE
jgi:hypothetical protein